MYVVERKNSRCRRVEVVERRRVIGMEGNESLGSVTEYHFIVSSKEQCAW